MEPGEWQLQHLAHVAAVVAAVCEEQVDLATVFCDALNGGGLPRWGQIFEENVISLNQTGESSVPLSAKFRDDSGDQGVAEVRRILSADPQ